MRPIIAHHDRLVATLIIENSVGESLINVVNLEQAQDAERLNQKVSGQGQVFDRHLPQMVYHRRTGET
jgi:hypothetical protein